MIFSVKISFYLIAVKQLLKEKGNSIKISRKIKMPGCVIQPGISTILINYIVLYL